MAQQQLRTCRGAAAIITGAASGIGRGHGGRYGKVYSDLTPEQPLKSVEPMRPITPARFARQALDAVARNQAVIVVPGWWKLFWWLNRLSPDLLLRLTARIVNVSRSPAAGR